MLNFNLAKAFLEILQMSASEAQYQQQYLFIRVALRNAEGKNNQRNSLEISEISYSRLLVRKVPAGTDAQ